MRSNAASLSQTQFELSFMQVRTAESGLKPDNSELIYKGWKYFCKERIASLCDLIRNLGNLVFHQRLNYHSLFFGIALSCLPIVLYRVSCPSCVISHGSGV